jgi:hypothetical protein
VTEIVHGHAVAGDFGPRRPREIRLPVVTENSVRAENAEVLIIREILVVSR